VSGKDVLNQKLERYQPLTKLTRRLSRLDEIPWMAQAGDIKHSLQTIKQVANNERFRNIRMWMH